MSLEYCFVIGHIPEYPLPVIDDNNSDDSDGDDDDDNDDDGNGNRPD